MRACEYLGRHDGTRTMGCQHEVRRGAVQESTSGGSRNAPLSPGT